MGIQKILVVDDSKTELHFLSDVLTKRGYQVRTAENGEDAMRRLGEDKPDLILMDVVMPGQNGFQLTRSITRDSRLSGQKRSPLFSSFSYRALIFFLVSSFMVVCLVWGRIANLPLWGSAIHHV